MSVDYTPTSIADIVFASPTEQAKILNIANGSAPFPFSGKNGILLYGTVGTGKTSLACLLPEVVEKHFTGNAPLVEFHRIKQGANGAELIDAIQKQCQFAPLTSEYHYFVLDEVDNLTVGAMASLRSVMNLTNAVFILTTNNRQKVEKGAQNRCHIVEFNAAPSVNWLPLFKRVLTDFTAPIPNDSILLPIIDACNGSARDIVNSAVDLAIRLGGLAPPSNFVPRKTLFTLAPQHQATIAASSVQRNASTGLNTP